MSSNNGGYYLPEPTKWPLIGSVGLFLTLGGFAMALPTHNDGVMGNMTVMFIGLAVIIYMLFGWFGTVIRESEAGQYNDQVDRSFRMGMIWFIFSEVMFFAAFFGVLYYVREFSVPWLGGAGNNAETAKLLWPGFDAVWPMLTSPDTGIYTSVKEVIGAWGIPALNTVLLLSSGVTVTLAHHALKANKRGPLVIWLFATVVLGFTFLGFQISEYTHAYTELDLTLASGIYGSTFFMLTGFHGLHVTLGAIMLSVILLRCMKGHFKPDSHFGFEAVAWYWHFVDVVWLGLFIFVYWL